MNDGSFIPAPNRERVVISPTGEKTRMHIQAGESGESFGRRCERFRRSRSGHYGSTARTVR